MPRRTAIACLCTATLIATVVGCDTWPDRLPVAPMRLETLRSSETLELNPSTEPATQVTTTHPTASTQTVEPATKPVEVPLTLAAARAKALHYNLELSASLLDPAISRAALSQEETIFDATFTTQADFSTTDSPTASRLNSSQSKSYDVTPGLQVPLITGGSIQVSAPITRSESNNEFSELNPAYTSDLVASVTQPLLRGFGTDVNEAPIRIAFYQNEQTELQTKLEAIRVIANVDRAYWRLHAARRDLEVRVQAVQLANDQIERARRLVNAQQAADVEILRAQSAAADQVEQVITAENAVRQRQRELKVQMNDPNLPIDEDAILVPESVPTTLSFDIEPRALVDRAVHQRTELLNAELTVIERGIDVAVARNGLLPLLTLQYQYRINGLGKSLDDALDEARTYDFADHSVGLQVEVPIGNRAANARYRSALLQRLRAIADRNTQVQTIRQEVLDAVDAIRSNYQSVIAARQRTALNERLLAAEIRQFEHGQRTSTEVRNAQIDYANAQSLLVAAEANYQISQVDLAFATGTTLGSARVSWTPTGVRR